MPAIHQSLGGELPLVLGMPRNVLLLGGSPSAGGLNWSMPRRLGGTLLLNMVYLIFFLTAPLTTTVFGCRTLLSRRCRLGYFTRINGGSRSGDVG